ncbi:hypothetical protein TL5118_03078 [Thalassovita autumnalis]|uniref:Uncharacterized protein n=1 Tax=Thalassovita autumnalis TaxID=2072972 RepID=A0A0P1G5U7_9RHOB|nr:hypothetical protein [Thalassovita autumnalis]CUH69119.1 hypothetical protein TL5118_03078 [Thalassovita autumnalis]CUH73678.1 hypothetical protein TL5120_03490 [Thalassovita autumnalis]
MTYTYWIRAGFSALLTSAVCALPLAAQEVPQVTDPISGDTVALTEVDLAALTRAQIHAISKELQDLGYSRKDAKEAIKSALLDDVTVTDPDTGILVALDEIDITALSDEELADILEEARTQGVTRRDVKRELMSAVEVTDPLTGETTTLAEIDKSALTDEQRQALRDEVAALDLAGAPSGDGAGHGKRAGKGPGAARGNGPGKGGGDRSGAGGAAEGGATTE